jgi:hypothetical protein
MHIILRSTSQLVRGLLVAAGRGRMRVVVERQKDALELRRIRGQWLSDNGSKIEIAFVLTNAAVQRVSSDLSVRAAGAAS